MIAATTESFCRLFHMIGQCTHETTLKGWNLQSVTVYSQLKTDTTKQSYVEYLRIILRYSFIKSNHIFPKPAFVYLVTYNCTQQLSRSLRCVETNSPISLHLLMLLVGLLCFHFNKISFSQCLKLLSLYIVILTQIHLRKEIDLLDLIFLYHFITVRH